MRNLTKKIEVDPWQYSKPFELSGNLGARICVALLSGKKFLTADIVNVTFYIDEFDA